MRPLTLKIAAGAVEAIPVNGRYVRNGDLSATITVQDEASGDYAILAAGDAVQFQSAYRRLLISHAEATEQTVVITFGFGQILTARTVGTVAIDGTVIVSKIDERKAAVEAGNCFIVAAGATGAAAQFGTVQLWNNAASGKNIILRRAHIGALQAFLMRIDKAAVVFGSSIGTHTVQNKLHGGSATAGAEARSASVASVPADILVSLDMPANGLLKLDYEAPIILPPGSGLNVSSMTAATTVRAIFEFDEEVI